MFSEFENVLGDSYRTTWHVVLNEHFPKPLEEASPYSCDKKEDFDQAIEVFIAKILDNKNRETYSIFIWPPEVITASQRTYLPCCACIHTVLKRCSTLPTSF